MMKQDARRKREVPTHRLKVTLLIALIVIISISTVSFSYKFYEMESADARMAHLEQAILDLKAAMNVDSVRQYNIRRIMSIIDRYNKDLPSETKYEIASTIYEMSLKYTNLSVDLICATITQESGWKPDVVSHAGAIGLMQIMPATGSFLACSEGIQWTSPEDVLFNPVYNVRLGCRYLSALVELYGVDGGLAAYNSGERRAALWLANNRDSKLLYQETRAYVPAILQLLKQFKNENGLM